jgi:MerR family transcriptional regulator, copper efflux regulator
VGFLDRKLLESAFMRISEAARRLGTSARMLRYREELGLLPQVRDRLGVARRWAGSPAGSPAGNPAGSAGGAGAGSAGGAGAGSAGGAGAGSAGGPGAESTGGAWAGPHGASHRQFSEADLEAVAAALALERRYDISPASLAFGLRVLAEPPVRAAVADLGRRLGRVPATPGRALDFEKERALRLLSRG